HPDADQVLDRAREIVAQYVDIDFVLALARASRPPAEEISIAPEVVHPSAVRIGYFRDSAFTFYYAENLEALRNAGAELVGLSSLAEAGLPEDLDGLYIGGGFPETHAAQLADNSAMRESVRRMAEAGLPIYAECGGLVYLGESLLVDEATYPMAGVFPVQLALEKKPQGHGYSRLAVDRENPFFPIGTTINAHEFHYTHIINGASEVNTACAVEFGTGCFAARDGLTKNRTMANYYHLHALGTTDWAPAFVRLAEQYHEDRGSDVETGCPSCCGASGM
ncbi:cobyrinic acid a,c-diamide synthase, partial [Candidatus Zixiibacteriota bacterium]